MNQKAKNNIKILGEQCVEAGTLVSVFGVLDQLLKGEFNLKLTLGLLGATVILIINGLLLINWRE